MLSYLPLSARKNIPRTAPFFITSLSNLQKERTGIKFWTGFNSGQIWITSEWLTLERLKIFISTYNGENVSSLACSIFIGSTSLPECGNSPNLNVPGIVHLISIGYLWNLQITMKDIYELRHEKKTTKWVCTQQRLRSAWASSLCAQWIVKGPWFVHADSEDWSDWLVLSSRGSYSLRWHKLGHITPAPYTEGCRGWNRTPTSWANYFKIMKFFTRNGVYTPNFA